MRVGSGGVVIYYRRLGSFDSGPIVRNVLPKPWLPWILLGRAQKVRAW